MSQQEVIDLMRASSSSTEWNNNCDKVKKAFGGDYPSFWFSTIILSGVYNEVQATW